MTYTYKDFLAAAKNGGVAFRHPKQATYYWNLWVDSCRYGCKNTAAKPTMSGYIAWMRKQ